MPAKTGSYGSMSPRVPVAVTIGVDGTEEALYAKVLPPYAEVTQLHADLSIVSNTLGTASHTFFGQYGLRVIYGEIPVDDAFEALAIQAIVNTLYPVSGDQVFEGTNVAETGLGLLGVSGVTPVAYSKAYTLWSRTETLSLPGKAILIGDAIIALADKVKIRSYPNKRKKGFRKPRRESFKMLAIMMNSDVVATQTDEQTMMFGDATGGFETLVSAFEAALIQPEAGTGDDSLANDADDYLVAGIVEAGLAVEPILNVTGHVSMTAEYYKRTAGGRKHWRPV